MVVAVQKGLCSLKKYLSENGFETVYYGAYNYPVDAVVYKGAAASPLQNSIPCGERGVFFVNAKGKTPYQVAKILSDRLYTPLF